MISLVVVFFQIGFIIFHAHSKGVVLQLCIVLSESVHPLDLVELTRYMGRRMDVQGDFCTPPQLSSLD